MFYLIQRNEFKINTKRISASIIENTVGSQTVLGSFKLKQKLLLKDIFLPKFDKSTAIKIQPALISNQPCSYDLIPSQHFLLWTSIILQYESCTLLWLNKTIPLYPQNSSKSAQELHTTLFYDDTSFIQDTAHKEEQPKEIVQEKGHLISKQHQHLKIFWQKYRNLFKGKLGFYIGKALKLNLSKRHSAKIYTLT